MIGVTEDGQKELLTMVEGYRESRIMAAVMSALDVRMAKLKEAYDQIAKRLDDVHGDVQQLRGEIHTELQQLRTELQTEMRNQFWQFAALVLPLWLAAAALFFRR